MTGSSQGSRETDWLPKGTRLNDTYELDQGIASGGMGEIYRGHNIQTGSSYAIKMIRSDFAETEGAMTMFLREAGALNDLFHEAIVRYFAFSVDPTLRRPYMVMEFVTGRSLSEIIKHGPMDYEDVRVLGMRLAAGLQIAHDRGIIHRDIAPDNILVPDGDVSKAKIIDFGIARQTQATDGTIIGDGFAGKYNYVSPEQLGMFGGNVSGTSDIYSLALVLAEALAGRSLNMRGSQFEVIDKRRVVPDLRHIDARMQPLLEDMLQPDPADRPGSMTEVAARLRIRGTAPSESGTGRGYVEETVIQSRREPSRTTGYSTGHDPSPSYAPSRREPAQTYRPPGPSEDETVFEDPRRPPTRNPSFRPGPEGDAVSLSRVEQGYREPPPTAREPVQPYVSTPSLDKSVAPIVPPKKSGSRGLLVAGLVVLLLAGGGGGGYLFWQKQARETKTDTKISTQDHDVSASKPSDADTSAKHAGPADGRQVDFVRYLANYQGGACFYANPIVATDRQMVAEGFGHSIAPFEQLDKDFRQKTGVDADIRLREVADAQCPAIDFLARTRVDAASRPKIEVVDNTIKAGDLIVGEAKAPPGLYLLVLLVADDGSVKLLAHSDKPDGAPLPFQSAAERLTGGGGKPGLIVAVSSKQPLDLTGFTGKIFAGQAMEQLTAESTRRGDKLASAAQYLVLQR
jgi:serine/threonine-protein kinase